MREQSFTGRQCRCFHLRPRSSEFQQRMLSLLLVTVDTVFKLSPRPEIAAARLLQLNRWICGLQTHYLKAGGLYWPYLEGGRGLPVVLLHGFGADKDRFGSLVPFLRRRFRVIIPDLPGFGEHRRDWSLAYDIHAQVQRLEEFIGAIGLKRFHLMGLSLGGYVAARYTVRYAQRIMSLALMDSAGFSSVIPSAAMRLFESSGHNIFLYTNEGEMDLLFRFLLHRPIKLPPALRNYWLQQGRDQHAWRRKLFDDLFNGGLDLMDALAPQIKVPTLIIWGADDRICHVSAVARILAAVENSRAYIIHNCGHLPLVEYPRLFRRIYLGFLTGSTSGSVPGARPGRWFPD